MGAGTPAHPALLLANAGRRARQRPRVRLRVVVWSVPALRTEHPAALACDGAVTCMWADTLCAGMQWTSQPAAALPRCPPEQPARPASLQLTQQPCIRAARPCWAVVQCCQAGCHLADRAACSGGQGCTSFCVARRLCQAQHQSAPSRADDSPASSGACSCAAAAPGTPLREGAPPHCSARRQRPVSPRTEKRRAARRRARCSLGMPALHSCSASLHFSGSGSSDDAVQGATDQLHCPAVPVLLRKSQAGCHRDQAWRGSTEGRR